VIDLRVETKYLQPSIEILNLRIDEPVTTITDILLAIICFYAFFRIRRLESPGRGNHYFRLYFLILGLGALTGGILGHAFLYRLAEEWKLLSWTLTLTSVALMVQALLEVSGPLLKKNVARMISWLNVLVFILALFLTLRSIDFDPVKYYSVFGLVLLSGSISYYIYRKTGNKGVLVLMGGVGIGFLCFLIFSLEWGISQWFNHRDLSHIILCFSVYFVYRGVAMILKSIISS
jgi:hypothetical protein